MTDELDLSQHFSVQYTVPEPVLFAVLALALTGLLRRR